MPLPPALLARLAKRGIVKEQAQPPQPSKPEEVEEVFAEDYDDPTKVDVPEPEPGVVPTEAKQESDQEEDDTEYIHDVPACPNRSNPYHVCVKYCKNRWGMKTFTPDSDMIRKRDRMLKKFPLPDGWKEVADPETGRYYYWSMQTDQVCWLSPGHPKAIISMPAEKLTGVLSSNFDDDFEDQDEDMENLDDEPMEADSDMSDASSDSDSEEERRKPHRDPEPVRQRGGGGSRGWREEKGSRRGGGGGRNRREEIDPMDPAAYSDVPRGGWTDGLDTRGSAKTGVDVTASGPLFQQRPYPSPGDILRANQQLKRKV